MSTTIYHFTGTGNSLKIAKDLAEALGESSLVALARASGEDLAPTTDTVGIVFPVYAWGPPAIVASFLDKLKVPEGTYVFAVCTCGGSASGTLVKVKKQLARRGIELASGFAVLMPSNYIAWGGAIPVEKQTEMFAAADGRIGEICEVVRGKQARQVEMGGAFGRFVTGLVYAMSANAFAKQDSKFVVGESCNGCGICAKVCQVTNIEMVENKPSWLHRCEQCLACIQWCPQTAIQVGAKTVGRERYHHPEIKAKELM